MENEKDIVTRYKECTSYYMHKGGSVKYNTRAEALKAYYVGEGIKIGRQEAKEEYPVIESNNVPEPYSRGLIEVAIEKVSAGKPWKGTVEGFINVLKAIEEKDLVERLAGITLKNFSEYGRGFDKNDFYVGGDNRIHIHSGLK